MTWADAALVMAAFLVGGMVKGTLGIGLPTTSLAILTLGLDLRHAVAVMAVPALVTNAMQALQGGHFRELLRAHWGLLAGCAAGVWAGTLVLFSVDPVLLSAGLGLLLCLYVVWNLLVVPVRLPHGWASWVGPLAGTATGLLAGATGSLVMPIVVYVQGLGLDRDRIVQLFGMAAVVLVAALALFVTGRLIGEGAVGPAALLGVPAAVGGMLSGQRLRGRLSEERFRKLFFTALFVLGANLVWRYLAA